MNKFKIGEQVLFRDCPAKVVQISTVETEDAVLLTYGIRLFPGGNRVEGVAETALSAIPDDFWQVGKMYSWVGDVQYAALPVGSFLICYIPTKPPASLLVGMVDGRKVFIEPDGVSFDVERLALHTRGIRGGTRVFLEYLAPEDVEGS